MKKSPRITLYTTRKCGYCRQVKRLLKELKIPFSEFDVEKNHRALQEFQRLGGRGVPLLVIGKQAINGYHPGKIKAALKQAEFHV